MSATPVVPPWWAGLAPATAAIACSGTTHRLEWRAGRLLALDHHDPDAELALAALGAEPPECLRLMDDWRRHEHTPELVTLGRRPGEQQLGLADLDRSIEQAAVVRVVAGTRGVSAAATQRVNDVFRRRDELRRLLALPGPMVDRLVLTVLAWAAERWPDETFRADHGLRLGAALSVRATPAIRRFGERLGCGTPDVGVSPARPDRGGPVVAARLETGQPLVVSADLPLRWLSNVWGRGISEPGEELVLDVVGGTDDGREFEVVVAEWEPAGPITWEAAPVPAIVTVDHDGVRRVSRRW